MDKSKGNHSELDQNSLGILSMENLKVFGDLSSLDKSSSSIGPSNLSARLKAERARALETLERPRASRSQVMGRNSTLSMVSGARSINISELITDETIDLNSSGGASFASMPCPKGSTVSFEPAEITGRSTLCQTENQSFRHSISVQSKKNISVADILKSSFVEKARQLEKKLQNNSEQDPTNTTLSSMTESLNCSHSLPRTADMSQQSNLSLNGGNGFSFSSAAAQEFNQSDFIADADFAPGELMQSKLVLGEISWAQEFTAMPTATLSKPAMEKAAAPAQIYDIETSVSNSVIAGDPNFSVGNFFRTRSENIWNIVSNETPNNTNLPQSLVDPNSTIGSVMSAIVDQTPKVDNKTYTKSESAKLETNMWKKKQQEKVNNAIQPKEKRWPSSSELLSLSAIDRALCDLDLNTDTSAIEVVDKLWGRGHAAATYDEEDKENSVPTLVVEESTNRSSHKHTDTMDFTDSVLNSTDFIQLQQSILVPRKPLSPLSQPMITVTEASKVDANDAEAHEADIDEWPSTPVKSPGRRIRRTKSPNSVSPHPGQDLQLLPTTTTDDDDAVDEDKTPVNLKRNVLAKSRNPTSLSSTRLDGCDVLPSSSTECDFGISPSLARSSSTTNATLTSRNASPLSSPRSCLSSSPMLDSTTSSDRRMLMASAARKINSSPASSEANSTSGVRTVVNGSQLSGTGRSISRCSNSSEFSHRDGKLLPLKVTHTSLCWGSTKLRTDVRKSMQVKNTADKRLVMRLGIQGPGFQLVSGDCNTITLQAMECRTISITFCPTVCGAAKGALSFYAPVGMNNSNVPTMEIPLYGYGGNASISIQGLQKGPVGASFLTMGDVCELSSGPLLGAFKFYNKGPLPAFAGISVDSTVLMKPRLCETFEISPSKVIIPPHSEALVKIAFRPNREDIKNILKKSAQVLTLANMRIFCGDEPNRQRMRSLVQRMSNKQREQLTSSMLDSIWNRFPNEQTMRNIASLLEPPEFILDLVTSVRIIDVALTLNRDIDESAETSLMYMPDAEETVLFRTICVANSPTPTQCNMLEPVDELLEADTTSQPALDDRHWLVQPTTIKFDWSERGNGHNVMSVVIENYFKSRQYFEITCNVGDILQIEPTECYVAPEGGQAEIMVRCPVKPEREILKKDVLIVVSMENEQINVPVIFNI
ncbi:uncharacterized protein LOC115633102 [Scaptodrosophila lebanonensis]|uniref:Uncharacterized protein LOC115633102 n=1 Tax=Drosophila lebanonensis TaxID=7225 RepID=A0A6J2UG19_DROLE|nr:uncharacterized protein LOC115633102 [Scaptodrosophila lebanonensis]